MGVCCCSLIFISDIPAGSFVVRALPAGLYGPAEQAFYTDKLVGAAQRAFCYPPPSRPEWRPRPPAAGPSPPAPSGLKAGGRLRRRRRRPVDSNCAPEWQGAPRGLARRCPAGGCGLCRGREAILGWNGVSWPPRSAPWAGAGRFFPGQRCCGAARAPVEAAAAGGRQQSAASLAAEAGPGLCPERCVPVGGGEARRVPGAQSRGRRSPRLRSASPSRGTGWRWHAALLLCEEPLC